MASENSQNSFRRGAMTLVILALLNKEDMYGYQLVQEIQLSSGGRIVTQEGSLYPVLYKLLEQGLISDRKVQVGKRMTRIYYHLEPAGERKLQELIREYDETTQGIRMIVEGEIIMETQLNQYYRSVHRRLPCDRKMKAKILGRIKEAVNGYLEEHPLADMDPCRRILAHRSESLRLT